jgi:hypothetical protein
MGKNHIIGTQIATLANSFAQQSENRINEPIKLDLLQAILYKVR